MNKKRQADFKQRAVLRKEYGAIPELNQYSGIAEGLKQYLKDMEAFAARVIGDSQPKNDDDKFSGDLVR